MNRRDFDTILVKKIERLELKVKALGDLVLELTELLKSSEEGNNARINAMEALLRVRDLKYLEQKVLDDSRKFGLQSVTEGADTFSEIANGDYLSEIVKEIDGVDMSSKYDLLELIQGDKKCPNRVEKLNYWIDIKRKCNMRGSMNHSE